MQVEEWAGYLLFWWLSVISFNNDELFHSLYILSKCEYGFCNRLLGLTLWFPDHKYLMYNKKEEHSYRISSFLWGWLVGLEPTTFRTTIWRSNRLNYSHHVSAFLKCGAKIGIIFDTANFWRLFFWKTIFFIEFLGLNQYIAHLWAVEKPWRINENGAKTFFFCKWNAGRERLKSPIFFRHSSGEKGFYW